MRVEDDERAEAEALAKITRETEEKAAADRAVAQTAEAEAAVLRRRADEIQARVAQLEAAQRTERFAAEAKAYGLPANVARILDVAESGVGPELYAKLRQGLMALKAQVDASRAFAEAEAGGGRPEAERS